MKLGKNVEKTYDKVKHNIVGWVLYLCGTENDVFYIGDLHCSSPFLDVE